ncbi:MAG: hypothetical protein QOF53_3516, partial [Nocardioidaceae bacterium]|nr:hypothetical protein [Nocardioidaceae bacterium]
LWMGARVDDCRAMLNDIAGDLRTLWGNAE